MLKVVCQIVVFHTVGDILRVLQLAFPAHCTDNVHWWKSNYSRSMLLSHYNENGKVCSYSNRSPRLIRIKDRFFIWISMVYNLVTECLVPAVASTSLLIYPHYFPLQKFTSLLLQCLHDGCWRFKTLKTCALTQGSFTLQVVVIVITVVVYFLSF